MSNFDDNQDIFANEPEFGAYEEAQAYLDQYKEESAIPETFKYEVRKLLDGETIKVIFMGGADEPFRFSQHSCSPTRAGASFKEKVLCAGAGCALCNANAMGPRKDPPIGRATPYMSFSVYSTRKIAIPPQGSGLRSTAICVNAKGHYLVKKKNGKVAATTTPPQFPAGTTFEDEGVRAWTGSALEGTSNCSEIMSMIASLRTRCTCGKMAGTGIDAAPAEIRVDGCKCAKCGAPMSAASRGRITTCASCQNHGLPVDRLVCTASCGNPQRLSLRNGYVAITRVGGDKDTKYRFDFIPTKLSDQHKMAMTEKDAITGKVQLKKLPLKEMYTPKTSNLVRELNARGFDAKGRPVEEVAGSNISTGYAPSTTSDSPFGSAPAAAPVSAPGVVVPTSDDLPPF